MPSERWKSVEAHRSFLGEPFSQRLGELEACRLAQGYAGEVALSEAELVELAPIVAQELGRRLIRPALSGRFILLTVNCAYYRMQGGNFWPPCCALLGRDPTQAALDHLRARSEESLQQWGFQIGRYNAGFRYVTPIRLQAGLTRHDLPAFARVLEAGRVSHGWAQMLQMPHAEYVGFLYENFSVRTRFVEFLEEETGGGTLMRDVLTDLVHWQQGLLAGAPYPCGTGYRPGFWEELWPLLHTAPQLQSARQRQRQVPLARPGASKFIFDQTRAQFGLLFPQTLVNQRACRLEGDLVHESFLVWKRVADLRREYTVEEKTAAGDWQSARLTGWVPVAEIPFTLFLPGGDLLPPGSEVGPGTYVLIAEAGVGEPPPSVHCLTDFEYVEIAGGAFRFWQIELDADSDPAVLGHRRLSTSAPKVSWVEPARRLRGAGDAAELFVDRLPLLQLDHAEDFRANRRVLCCDRGGGLEVLPVAGEAGTVQLRLPFSAPCTGEIWVETLGRSRTDERVGRNRLSFCLLPACEIAWPEGLYAQDDEPPIVFSSPGEVTADFPSCGSHGTGEWTLPAGETWVEGEVRAGVVSARVAWRVFQAAVEDENGVALFEERRHFKGNSKLRARGLPGRPVKMGLRGSGPKLAEIILQQPFDRYGVAAVSGWDVLDALPTRGEPVIRLEIWSGTEWVRTRGLLVDFAAVEEWLFDPERDPSASWLELGGEAMVAAARGLARLLDSGGDSLALPAALPALALEWAEGIVACAGVFSEPSRGGERAWDLRAVSPPRRLVLDWVLRARKVFDHGGEDPAALAAECPDPVMLPAWAPWRSRVLNFRDRLNAVHNLEVLVAEWRVDVLERGLTEPQSTLGTMPGGEGLTQAYAHNYAARYRPAFRALQHVPADAPEIVRGLRTLLDTLLRLQLDGGPGAPAETAPRRLRPLLAGLWALGAKEADWPAPPTPYVTISEVLPPLLLPLREEQTVLLQAGLASLRTMAEKLGRPFDE